MSGIQSFKNFIAKHRHLMTPDQALKADQIVLDSNVHVPSTNATHDELVGQKFLKDPDWYRRQEGNNPTAKPLYPTAELQTSRSNSNEAPVNPVGGENRG